MAGKKALVGVGALAVVLLLLIGPHEFTEGSPLDYTPYTGSRMFYTPLSIDFGPVGVGSTSSVHAVTITNTGSITLTNFAGGGVAAPFSASQNCAGGVAPGASCQYFFTFSPSAPGTFTATSASTTGGGSIVIQLRGEGVGPKLHVSSTSLDFGFVSSGSTSATQTVTIRNTGKATLTNFAGGGVTAPFSEFQNCAGGVAPGASCQFFYTFAPTTKGRFHRTSSISTNGGAVVVDLWGGEQLKVYLPFVLR